MERWNPKDGNAAGGASRHYSASAIGWGFLGFVSRLVASTNLVPPPFSFIALCDRGPPTRSRLSAPDQDAIKGSDSIVGSSQMRSILTFSPFISSYTLSLVLNLKYLTRHPFHYKLVYRACLVIIVSTIRLTGYNTHFYFKTDL